jgi:hypothetical protein
MDIIWKDPNTLHAHKLLEAIPELPYDCPERLALAESVRAEGILQPLLIQGLQIVDGRHRNDAARRIGLKLVPCIEIEGAVADIIVDSLTQRRHYTKSALAYAALPLMTPYIAAGVSRRAANIKAGGSADGALSAPSGRTREIFAQKLGLGARLLGLAVEVSKLVEEMNQVQLQDGEYVPDWVNRQIFQEGMGIGTVCQSLAVIKSNKSGMVQKGLSKRKDIPMQILSHFQLTQKHFSRWDKMHEGERRAVTSAIPDIVHDWPDDVLAVMVTAAKNELGHRHSK